MKLINSSVEYVPQSVGLEGIYRQIELVGRSCWMSQDLIKEDSATSFVKNLQKKGHTSPLEHGTVYLKSYNCCGKLSKYQNNPYSRYINVYEKSEIEKDELHNYYTEYVSTNYRVLVENDWTDDLQYLCEFNPEYHIPRLTFHFTCQRAISAEYNRHRKNSPMESSSRYCNFSNNKFGQEISICPSEWLIERANNSVKRKFFRKPQGISAVNSLSKSLEEYCYFIYNGDDIKAMSIIDYWLFANLACEYSYMNLIRLGAKAEEARDVLPFDTKTELYHTAFLDDWLHFCQLRAWKSKGNIPHKEAMKLANCVFNDIKSLGFVTEEFRKAHAKE